MIPLCPSRRLILVFYDDQALRGEGDAEVCWKLWEVAVPSLQENQLPSGGCKEPSLGTVPGPVLGGTEHHPDGSCVGVDACVHRREYSQKANAESSQDPSVRVGQSSFLQCFLKKIPQCLGLGLFQVLS